MNPHDAFQQTQSGFFVPKRTDDGGEALTEADAAAVLAQRRAEALAQEIAAGINWVKRWPKVGEGEKKLTSSDVLDLVLSRARAWMWDRQFTEEVYFGVREGLGLNPQTQVKQVPRHDRSTRRQAARDAVKAGMREGKPTLKLAASPPALDPMAEIAAESEREAARGFTEHNPETDQHYAPYNDESEQKNV